MIKQAARPLILFITFGFSLLFLFYSSKQVWGYPFSETTHNSEAWIYFLSESLVRIMLAYYIWQLEPLFRWCATAFLWLSVADAVDYVLTCNEKWNPQWPDWATLNTFSVGIFGLVFVAELIVKLIKYRNANSNS